LVLLLVGHAGCAPAPTAPAPSGGWGTVAALLDSVIAEGVAPGAVVAVSYQGRHYFHGAGRLGIDDATRPDSSTIYDLASLSKVVGLTTLTMQAMHEGRLELDAPVARYLPEFLGSGGDSLRTSVLIRHLLTHSSGLPAWRPLYQEASNRREALSLADTTALAAPPGSVSVYSDLGAIVLTQVIERVLGARIDTLFATRVARPLGLTETRYLPPESLRRRIAPTENDPWRGRVLRGEVHDENAARLDGVSGHAGLFSSARDLLRFADWLIEEAGNETGDVEQAEANRAQARGRGGSAERRHSTLDLPAGFIAEFTRRQDLPPGSSRALGWDTPSEGSSGGHYLHSGSFGHTGFTGTSIWIDPGRRLAIVLLSNRVHPTRANSRFGPVRALIADRVADWLGLDSVSH
jgi:CubicO group peptidase (beta-lactamase class C family)